MATVNGSSSSTKVRDCLKTSKRVRGNELSERKVDCIVPGCEVKSKTYRVVAKHFLKAHSNTSVLSVGKIPSCEWFCMKSLKCFTEHMKIHDVVVGPETELFLRRSKSYQTGHSGICNSMKSNTVAAKLEKLKVAKEIAKNTKKVNKDKLAKNCNEQNPEIQNEVEVNDNHLAGSEVLEDGVESLVAKLRTEENAENVNIQQIVNPPSVPIEESLSDSEYSSEADDTDYWGCEEEEEEIVERFILPTNLAFKREFEEITLSGDEEDEDEFSEEADFKKRKLNVKKVLRF